MAGPAIGFGPRKEDWAITAARAAAEVLGATLPADGLPAPVMELRDFGQSDFDGTWKVYQLYVFTLSVREQTQAAPGLLAEWLTPDDFQQREPVSRTARYVIDHLRLEGKLT